MTRRKSVLSLLILFFIIFLIHRSMAQEGKKCPTCNAIFPSEYNFCPYDGTKLLASQSDIRDIDGFQNFKWEMSAGKVKEILGDNEYEIDSSITNFIVIRQFEFAFQDKEASLEFEFYNDNLFKMSVHFMVESNVSGYNEYMVMAELLQEIYGDTERITIGQEAVFDNQRIILIRIGALYYQYVWKTISGNLIFQLSSGDSNHFVCSLFFSSQNVEQIEKNKIISEF